MKKEFYRKMWYFTFPITLQLLITSGLSMIDSVMVGKLGVDAIAAVGIANKYSQFLIVILQGFASGATIFCAQFWGQKNLYGIKKIIFLVSQLVTLFSVAFACITLIWTKKIVMLFSQDVGVTEQAIPFLQLLAIGYLFTGLAMVFSVALKTIGQVRWPTVISLATLLLNTGLNWLLIYGNGGFPQLGIKGAGLATLIARLMQALLLGGLLVKQGILRAEPQPDNGTTRNYFRITLPSIINHLTWTLGDLVIFWLFTRIGTLPTAAIALIDPLVFVFICVFSGISDASSVMIGNELGARNKATALFNAKQFIKLTVGLSLVSCVLIYIGSPLILQLYAVTVELETLVQQILLVYILILPFKNVNYVNNVGILRVGGDTQYVMWLDTLVIWLWAIPITYFSIRLALPFPLIYLCACSHDVLRALIGIKRTQSKRWLRTII